MCGLRRRRRFAPPVQGHDTHTQRARNFALRFPLPRQIICVCQLRRDFDPGVPFLLSHSSLYSTSDIRLFGLLVNFAWSKRWSICSGLGGCVGHWRGGASSISVIYDEVEVWVRQTQLACDLTPARHWRIRDPPALRFNQWSPNGPDWFKGPLLPAWHNLYAITIETIVALTRKAPRRSFAALKISTTAAHELTKSVTC